MSAFTADDVRRLAALARLDLDLEETEAFTRQLSDILEFARQVQNADAGGVETREESALAAAAPTREDTRVPSLSRDALLSEAPDGDPATGLFKVPRVLKG
jgi:aspartyl-tRNA(Asn)/glutamyl-tRNA(Gln) amidotransferase subunit C